MGSMANAMAFNPFEVDELRARLSNLTREKLKWEDTQRDLERAKAELRQIQDDFGNLQEYCETLKRSADDAVLRCEQESRARQEAEMKLLNASLSSKKELQHVKLELEELQRNQSRVVEELKDTHSRELQHRVYHMSCEYEAKLNFVQDRVAHLEEELEKHRAAAKQATQLSSDIKVLERRARELESSLDEARSSAQASLAKMKGEHDEAMESFKAIYEEQLHRERHESKAQLGVQTEKVKDMEKKVASLSDELFTCRKDLQDKCNEVARMQVDVERRVGVVECDFQRQLTEAESKFNADIASLQFEKSKYHQTASSLKRELDDVQEALRKANSRCEAAERDHECSREEISSLKSENDRLCEKLHSAAADMELYRSDLGEFEERFNRAMVAKETAEQAAIQDAGELRERSKKLEAEVLHFKGLLSTERRAKYAADTEYRRQISELTQRLHESSLVATKEYSAEFHDAQDRIRELEGALRALQHEQQAVRHALSMGQENNAELQRRCEVYEMELSLLRAENTSLKMKPSGIEGRADSTAPAIPRTEVMPPAQEAASCPVERAGSRVPLSSQPHNADVSDRCSKRHRAEEPRRIVTMTGFEDRDLSRDLCALPNVSIIASRSNAPVPEELTHLICNGSLTIKLLSALVRGCWILPKRFAQDSVAAQQWLDEAAYGFRHETLPLLGKRIACTEGFKASKYYGTAQMIAHEGGAVMDDREDLADFVLCTSQENPRGEMSYTWDRMVRTIYPAPIS
jgi:chromosome segregation ATPase